MKMYLKSFVLIFLLISCSETKKQNEEISDEETLSVLNSLDSISSSYQDQRIVLVSVINEIHMDTAKKIIKDYNSASSNLFNSLLDEENNKIDFDKLLDSISTKYLIEKRKAAKIIYEYNSLEKDYE